MAQHRDAHSMSSLGPPALAGDSSCGIFLFAGEGAHSADTDVAHLKECPSWAAAEAALHQMLDVDMGLATFLADRLGAHAAPMSPVVTTIINVLNADRWREAGHLPGVVVGHSIGEVGAAYVAGLLSIEEALQVAHVLGTIGAQRVGAMVHCIMTCGQADTWSSEDEEDLVIAAVNGLAGSAASSAALPPIERPVSVSLCGGPDAVERWLYAHPQAKKLKPPHPWHHPLYATVPMLEPETNLLSTLPPGRRRPQAASAERIPPVFVSSVYARRVDELGADYWLAWLTKPVDFKGALDYIANMLADASCASSEAVSVDLAAELCSDALATLVVEEEPLASTRGRSRALSDSMPGRGRSLSESLSRPTSTRARSGSDSLSRPTSTRGRSGSDSLSRLTSTRGRSGSDALSRPLSDFMPVLPVGRAVQCYCVEISPHPVLSTVATETLTARGLHVAGAATSCVTPTLAPRVAFRRLSSRTQPAQPAVPDDCARAPAEGCDRAPRGAMAA